MIPYFDIEVTTRGQTDIVKMSYLHMSHRYGPVTTARLLAGDTVERFSRDRVKIVGMTMGQDTNRQEAAL
jgi:hypothetical protein